MQSFNKFIMYAIICGLSLSSHLVFATSSSSYTVIATGFSLDSHPAAKDYAQLNANKMCSDATNGELTTAIQTGEWTLGSEVTDLECRIRGHVFFCTDYSAKSEFTCQ